MRYKEAQRRFKTAWDAGKHQLQGNKVGFTQDYIKINTTRKHIVTFVSVSCHESPVDCVDSESSCCQWWPGETIPWFAHIFYSCRIVGLGGLRPSHKPRQDRTLYDVLSRSNLVFVQFPWGLLLFRLSHLRALNFSTSLLLWSSRS